MLLEKQNLLTKTTQELSELGSYKVIYCMRLFCALRYLLVSEKRLLCTCILVSLGSKVSKAAID